MNFLKTEFVLPTFREGVNKMKNLKLILGLSIIIIFFVSCNHQREMIAHKPKEFEFGIGKSCLGISFDEFLKHIKHDSVTETDCLVVFDKGEMILQLSDKNYLSDRIVRMIDIYSEKLAASEGIRVGMPVVELLKKFPDMELNVSEEGDGAEYFMPKSLQTCTANGYFDICTFVYVEGNKQKHLASKPINSYPTKKFSKEGKVTLVSIFMWSRKN
jgi:hypothetical protein